MGRKTAGLTRQQIDLVEPNTDVHCKLILGANWFIAFHIYIKYFVTAVCHCMLINKKDK